MNNVEQLVKMANQIGSFYRSDPDEVAATGAIANHVRSFWHPKMRKQIFLHLDEGGAGLVPLVERALLKLQAEDRQGRT